MCSCPDIPEVALREKPISIIKQIVGDDRVPGELKGVNPFKFECYTKLVFASNAPLKIPYHKGESALLNRMVYIPFHNSVPDDKKVPQLYRHLLDEAGCFIGLALEQRESSSDTSANLPTCLIVNLCVREFNCQQKNSV